MNEMPDDVERAELDSIGKTSPKDGPAQDAEATERPWIRGEEYGDGSCYERIYAKGGGLLATFWGPDPVAFANREFAFEAVNSHDALKARVQELEKAAAKRLQTGHDDRCVSNPNDPGVCVCGFMQLKEALRGK